MVSFDFDFGAGNARLLSARFNNFKRSELSFMTQFDDWGLARYFALNQLRNTGLLSVCNAKLVRRVKLRCILIRVFLGVNAIAVIAIMADFLGIVWSRRTSAAANAPVAPGFQSEAIGGASLSVDVGRYETATPSSHHLCRNCGFRGCGY
jgi:hypothetical protein